MSEKQDGTENLGALRGSDSGDVYLFMDANRKDPICGNCGSHRSSHFMESDEVFCNETTNGDVFTDTPSNDILASYMEWRHPVMYQSILRNWKFVNGHGQ